MPSHDGHQDPPGSLGAPGVVTTLALSEAERNLLVKACRAYRRTLPIYLQAGELESHVVDELIRKLMG